MVSNESAEELWAKIEQLSTQNAELENRGLKNKRRVTELESQLEAINEADAATTNDAKEAALQAQMELLQDSGPPSTREDALQSQVTMLRSQLQSQSDLFRNQITGSREREQELRDTVISLRTRANAEGADLRKQLNVALASDNVHRVQQLQTAKDRQQRECALRLLNMIFLCFRETRKSCFFVSWSQWTRQNISEKFLNYKLERATARATPGVKFGQTPLKQGQHVKSASRDYDTNRGDRWEVQLSPRGGSGATGVSRGGFAGSPRAASPGKFRTESGMSIGSAPLSPRDVQPWAPTTPKAATTTPPGSSLDFRTGVLTSSMMASNTVATVALQVAPRSVPSLPVTRPTSLSSVQAVSQVAFSELDSYTAPGSYEEEQEDEEEEEEEVLPPPKKVPSLSLEALLEEMKNYAI